MKKNIYKSINKINSNKMVKNSKVKQFKYQRKDV